MVGALATSAVPPRIEDEFGVGVMGQGRFELAGSVADIVVHFSQILDELGFRFGVPAPPIFVGDAVSVVVFTIDVIFVDLPVVVVITVVNGAVVNVVV
jgi:hypothetical protein